MATAYPPATQRVVDHLVGRGFTITRNGRTFTHPRAVVQLVDDGCACFTVSPTPRGEPPQITWEAQLTRAPDDVVAATVAAAIA